LNATCGHGIRQSRANGHGAPGGDNRFLRSFYNSEYSISGVIKRGRAGSTFRPCD
jgi:hypothetical protein